MKPEYTECAETVKENRCLRAESGDMMKQLEQLMAKNSDVLLRLKER